MSLSAFDDELAQVRTKKKEFLAKIDRIIPWGEWLTLIRPHYYKGERGNKPYDLELMLRIYLLQNLYDLSDEGCVAEVIDSRAFAASQRSLTVAHFRIFAEWIRAIRSPTAILSEDFAIC